MSDTPPSQDPSPPARRTPGIVVASIVAVAVFSLGNLIVNSLSTKVELPAPPALAGQPGLSPQAAAPSNDATPSPSAVEATGDAGASAESLDASPHDGGRGADARHAPTAEAAPRRGKEKDKPEADAVGALVEAEGESNPPVRQQAIQEVTPPVDAPRGSKREEEGDRPARKGQSGNCSLADKDIARDAWRRNAPAVCVIGDAKDQVALYLPVKGNAMSATYDFRRRQKLLRILAPAAESQLTMAQYKLRRHGFRDLRIGGEGQSGDGAKLRITFEKSPSEVAVDLKETFIKVVIPLPTAGSTGAAP